MLLNESSCNYCFLIGNPPPYTFRKVLDFDICLKKFSSNPNQLVLVSHTQLWLDQSHSKILETLITQEKSKFWFPFSDFCIKCVKFLILLISTGILLQIPGPKYHGDSYCIALRSKPRKLLSLQLWNKCRKDTFENPWWILSISISTVWLFWWCSEWAIFSLKFKLAIFKLCFKNPTRHATSYRRLI